MARSRGHGGFALGRRHYRQKRKKYKRVLWLSRLRIQCCHFCTLGCCCGEGSIPGLGTYTCYGCYQKKKKEKMKIWKSTRKSEDVRRAGGEEGTGHSQHSLNMGLNTTHLGRSPLNKIP